MKTEILPDDFIANIDTANEEIARLAKRLGRTTPDFVPQIYKANEEITRLKAELAKKVDVVIRPTPKLNVAPKPTDPPAPTKRKQSQATGLMRAIEANVANNGRPVHTTSSSFRPTGLLRAIEANIRDQKSKSKTDEHDN